MQGKKKPSAERPRTEHACADIRDDPVDTALSRALKHLDLAIKEVRKVELATRPDLPICGDRNTRFNDRILNLLTSIMNNRVSLATLQKERAT